MRHKTNHKHTALAVAMAAVLALSGCGSVAATKTVAPEAQTVEITESEVTVPETEETTVPETETVALETNNTKADLEVKTLTEITSEPSPKAETIGYTYTDMSTIMYAKSAVNVRSLPSTDGTRLGTLVANQPVAVTGQCNETGWYRIQYGDGEAYVSNKYLVSETVTTESTQTVQVEETPVYSSDPHMNELIAAAIAKFGPNIIIFDDGAIHDAVTWQELGEIDEMNETIITMTNGFDRAAAEEIWTYVNAERTAAGLNPIAWDEGIYNFACQRAQAIVTDYSHNGCGNYGENAFKSLATIVPYKIHMGWYNSPRHHSNYMRSDYTRGACAVYIYDGVAYAVENFALK